MRKKSNTLWSYDLESNVQSKGRWRMENHVPCASSQQQRRCYQEDGSVAATNLKCGIGMRKYTDAQLDEIKQRYPHEETIVIAESMGLNIWTIYNLAYKHKIKKTAEYYKGIHSTRLKPRHRNCIAGEFKKGHVPFNKGKKMPAEVYELLKSTMFKKGNVPANVKPIGHLSVRPDTSGREYIYIKIKDSVWELYHRYLWEQEHGEIPKKMKLVFINGNGLDCRLENMKLMTYQEAMLMNTIHRYTPEIKELIRLNNKLKQKLNGKEQNQ